jgi:hypothetical protein
MPLRLRRLSRSSSAARTAPPSAAWAGLLLGPCVLTRWRRAAPAALRAVRALAAHRARPACATTVAPWRAGLHHQAAGGLHGKVKRGACPARHGWGRKVVQHVDAAAKQHPPVHHAQLAVQAPPAAGAAAGPGPSGEYTRHCTPGRSEAGSPDRRQAARCLRHPPPDACARRAAPHGPAPRPRCCPGAGEVKDVGFEMNVRQGCIHGLDQRRKQLLRALVQAHIVVCANSGVGLMAVQIAPVDQRHTSEPEFGNQRQMVGHAPPDAPARHMQAQA